MTKALVLYHSQEYGNTGVMAEAVADGLRSAGCEVTMHNINEGRYDVKQVPQYDCLAIGSPDYYSYIAGTLKTFMDDHYIEDVHNHLEGLKPKPYALFYTHGGGGRVKDVITGICKRIGTLVGEPVGSKGKPDAQIIEKCKALGKELARAAL